MSLMWPMAKRLVNNKCTNTKKNNNYKSTGAEKSTSGGIVSALQRPRWRSLSIAVTVRRLCFLRGWKLLYPFHTCSRSGCCWCLQVLCSTGHWDSQSNAGRDCGRQKEAQGLAGCLWAWFLLVCPEVAASVCCRHFWSQASLPSLMHFQTPFVLTQGVCTVPVVSVVHCTELFVFSWSICSVLPLSVNHGSFLLL